MQLDKTLQVAATPAPPQGGMAARTYNYVRLGMLVAVAALAYSIVKEYRQPGVHEFLGSISGYYHTPARAIFIAVMVSIGFALLVIKGRTPVEDAFLSLAGIMAPIVAFIPTSDDMTGVGRQEMLKIGHYQPAPVDSRFLDASINNNLHAFVFAGYIAIGLVFIAFLFQWLKASADNPNLWQWISLAAGLALAIAGSCLLHWGYSWVLDGHARAALLMFVFLALAAIANSLFGLINRDTKKRYALTYLIVGLLMLASGGLFLLVRWQDWTSLGGHLVLAIEAAEIALFVIFWAFQTVERWNKTAGVNEPDSLPTAHRPPSPRAERPATRTRPAPSEIR